MPDRISRTYPDLADKKVCKICDFCVKPSVYSPENWRCVAPQNSLGRMDVVSGDWQYRIHHCKDVQYRQPDGCNWFQIDPYIPVNGIRQIDRDRQLSTPSLREPKFTMADLKKLTLDDI